MSDNGRSAGGPPANRRSGNDVSRGGGSEDGAPAEDTSVAELIALLQGIGAAADLMRDSDIGRLRLARGSFSLEVERAPAPPGVALEPGRTTGANRRPAAEHDGDSGAGPVPDPVTGADAIRLTAPLVGVFYSAPGPGRPPFVSIGDLVEPGQQVAIIEAMKFMNPVVTDRPGVVTAVHVEDNDIVEFDQLLITIAAV